MISDYLLLAAVVFGVNLLPAFGPPTWAVLVLFLAKDDLSVVPTVIVGAVSASLGRLVLAGLTRRFFRVRLTEKRRKSLAAAQEALTRTGFRKCAAVCVFVLSPIPSAQLFVAAGLSELALLPLTGWFLAGRLVTYSIYVSIADKVADDLGSTFKETITSPLAIALELVMLVVLVAVVRIDWAKRLAKKGGAEKKSRAHAKPRRA